MAKPFVSGINQTDGGLYPSSSRDASTRRSNRSCEACRVAKVRCFPGDCSQPDQGPTSCSRCAQTQRKCLFASPKKRRPRKRTETRVAELEREVTSMRSLLNGVHQFPSRNQLPTLADTEQDIEHGHHMELIDTTCSVETGQDVVASGFLSMETATKLFDRFVDELVPQYPIVAFAKGATASEIRETKPVLFLAAIAAAAGTSNQDLYRNLDTYISRTYADLVVIKGRKSLELVQAILVTSVWFYAPDAYEDLKFYQYIHMASTMAMDINLDKAITLPLEPIEPSNSSFTSTHPTGLPSTKSINPATEALERCRTVLACYLSCAR